jgi:hypothetical protein
VRELNEDQQRKFGGRKYELIIGYRRWVALTEKLKRKKIKVFVAPENTPTEHVIAGQLVENIQRQNLTTYEKASGLAELRDQIEASEDQEAKTKAGKVKIREVARRVGITESYAGHLLKIWDNLHPIIMEEWRKEHPKATKENLLEKIVGPSHGNPDWEEEQLKLWAQVCSQEGTLKGRKSKTPKEKVYGFGEGEGSLPLTAKVHQALFDLETATKIEEKKNPLHDKEWYRGAKAILSYILGGRKTAPVSLDVLKEGDSDDN